MGDASVSFSASGEMTLLFPQVNFCSSRGSQGCWVKRTAAEKHLVVLVGVLAVLLVACLLGLIFQYRASKSFGHFCGAKTPPGKGGSWAQPLYANTKAEQLIQATSGDGLFKL